jgi:hypothetical protein
MGESEEAPWRFSPLAVVTESLAFTAFHFKAIAGWALAPLVFGLAFHYLAPSPQGGEDASGFLPSLLLLGIILLWIRVPMEVRLYRKALLDEDPGHFYGLELIEARTWRYLWAYVRVICLFIGFMGPGILLAAMFALPLAKSGLAGSVPEMFKTLAPAVGMFVLLGLLYAVLAPRVILVFPEVVLGGQGLLFKPGALGEVGKKARWRMVAVMAMIWTPEHTLNAFSYIGGDWAVWKSLSESWWFTPASYLLGFATLIVSSVAGANMYRRLRSVLVLPEVEPDAQG